MPMSSSYKRHRPHPRDRLSAADDHHHLLQQLYNEAEAELIGGIGGGDDGYRLDVGDEFVSSLINQPDNPQIDSGPMHFVYQPHQHTEFLVPSQNATMTNLSTVMPAMDVTDMLLQEVSTLVPSLALPNTSLPLSASSASRDDIKTIKMISYCYILPLVCLLGIIGNLMNVVTLASPRLRAVSYMYLRALAIADLLCMCFVLFFASCEVLKEVFLVPIDRHPLFGFYQAHLMLSFINWTLSTGVLIVVALSLERYISVVFPLHFRAWNSPQRAMKAIMAAYLVPAFFYIPYGVARYTVKETATPGGHIIYIPDDSALSKTLVWQIYKWCREGLLRFLPIIILLVLNSQIMIAFRKRQRLFNRLRNRDQTVARDDTLLYILGGIAVMFFVCNIPAAINLLFINETVKKRLDYQIFRALANLLEITNHAAQFYIFCVCSSDYRITFMQKFPCFRVYYLNKNKFRSFLYRNVPKRSGIGGAERSGATGGTGDGSGGVLSGNVRGIGKGRSWSEKRKGLGAEEGTEEGEGGCVRSTTVTAELMSTCCGGARTITAAEQDTVDSRVQLASEESLSDESEMLLISDRQNRGVVGQWDMDIVGSEHNNNAGGKARRSDDISKDDSGSCFL